MNVEEGMAIKEGQVLARLDDAQYKAALALAEAQAEAARRNVRESEVRLAEARVSLGPDQQARRGQAGHRRRRSTPRRPRSTRSVARIDAAREQVRVAERQIEVERTNLDNTIVRAPFSGIAVSKDAQPGEMVSPNSAGGGFTRTGICTLVDMRSLEIEVDVNESYINRVQDESAGHRGAECVSRLADSGARHHDGAEGRSPEGDRAGAHRLQRARSADPARHGRQGDVPRRKPTRRRRRTRGPSRSCRRPPSAPTTVSPTPSSSAATTWSIGARSRSAAPTATGWRSKRVSAQASA